MIPCLMITYNRLDFTKQAFDALLSSKVSPANIFIIDNCSTDGTQEWLSIQPWARNVIYNKTNAGIAGAMNQFLEIIRSMAPQYCIKIDNDTIISKDFVEKMLPHMVHADIVQAKHHILKETHEGGFDEWVKKMPAKGALRFNHFVGGSGIMFKPDQVGSLKTTDNLIMGWRQWQREHPELKKAFATDVEIELLDTDASGAKYPASYIDYYRKIGRIK